MTRRKQRGTAPVNTYVEDRGQRYRVCHMPNGRVLMVGYRRAGEQRERLLEPDARRARQVVDLAKREHGIELLLVRS
jgi:hypothetical protein